MLLFQKLSGQGWLEPQIRYRNLILSKALGSLIEITFGLSRTSRTSRMVWPCTTTTYPTNKRKPWEMLVLNRSSIEMDTFTCYNISIAVVTFVSVISNAISYFYIQRTFDIKQCLSNILCIDAAIVTLSGITSLCLYALLISGYRFNEWLCLLLLLSTCLIIFTNPLCNFLVSYVR